MLNSNASTTKKIFLDWEYFSFTLKGTTGDFHSFDVSFKNQNGWLTINTENTTVKASNLNLKGFDRPLGSNNDNNLNELAKKVLTQSKVKY